MPRGLLVAAALMMATGALTDRLPASVGAPMQAVAPLFKRIAATLATLDAALDRH